MTIIRRTLREGIVHIEDLPLDEFIQVLRNLPNLVGQEKLDGANLWIGLDQDGKFFTSREGKRTGAERRYSAAEWPRLSAFNQFIAAHAALDQVKGDIQSTLKPGDTIEAEVIFGRQPNTVSYGFGGMSYIAFLRGVEGTQDLQADALGKKLANQQVQADVSLVDTDDGIDLKDTGTQLTFQFVTPQKINAQSLKIEAIQKGIEKLESFLEKKSSVDGYTNRELLGVQLGKVPQEQRDLIKSARSDLLATVQTEHKLPLKNILLNDVVRKVRSHLSADDLSDGEDIGIEGIVLRDPTTEKQVKVVDKDTFTTVNKFNQSVRGLIQSNLMTTDPDAPLESRGGIVGSLRIKIAELLGNRELAKQANVRKILEPIKGESPEDAIRNLAASMPDLNDYQMIKKKVLALISETYKELATQLDTFKEKRDEYELRLKNGKTIKLSDDTFKKTLLSFAEARRNLNGMFEKVKGTKTLAQLLAIYYGPAARAVHSKVDESLIFETKPRKFKPAKRLKHVLVKTTKPKHVKYPKTNPEINRNEYAGKDTFQIVNSYLANVFMALVIIAEKDTLGMRRLKDHAHANLKGFSDVMSPLNFWGYAVWRPTKTDVKNELQRKTESELANAIRHIPDNQWRFMHLDLSSDRQRQINYANIAKTVDRLMAFTGLRTQRLNSLLDATVRWPELTYDEKVKGINTLYYYALQFVPKSSLFVRLRAIQANMLLNPITDTNPTTMSEMKLIRSIMREADSSSPGSDMKPSSMSGTTQDAPSAGGDATQGTATSTSSDVAKPVEKKSDKKRTIVKRKRNPKIQRQFMRFKDPRKEEE